MALIRSSEFCLKLTYRYLLKAGNVLVNGNGDMWGGTKLILAPGA